MDIEEMRQAVRYARADAAEAKTQNARVEFAQAAHQLAMTAEICERLDRIEAAIRALGLADLRGNERCDAGDGSTYVGVIDRDRPVRPHTIG